jgi:putative NADH-flavin reductase
MLVDDFEYFGKLVSDPPKGSFIPEGPPIIDIPRGARIALYLFELERDLEWTVMSPSLYMGDHGGGTGRLRYGTNELLLDDAGLSAKLDIEDLAQAIIEQTENPVGTRNHITVATQY